MGDAGVDLVTVGVFSWAELEPAEGIFSFGWLREVLDLLGEAGIGVDLATPTASPPPWLTTRYPDVLPVDATGARYSHGSREHFCVCNPNYRQMARRIVERLAAEVGDHPAIEMWHLSNEYACHVPYCYCDHHAVAFRRWLEAALRFGGRPQRGVGDVVLEPAVRRLRRGPAAPDDADVRQPGPGPRFPALQQ